MSARVFRPAGGKVWHYRFQLAGKSVQRTTRETHKGRAQAVADDAYEKAKLAARGRNVAPPLGELVDLWIEAHEPVRAAAHIAAVSVFRRHHLYGLAEMQICDIDTAAVEEARNKYLATHAPSSGNLWVKHLKLVMKWAIRRKMIEVIPWQVPLVKLQKKPRATLPTSMVRAWLDKLDEGTENNPSMRTAVRLMLGIGLRATEAAGARWQWVNWERGTYTPGDTKGKEAVALPMPPWLIEYLRALPEFADGMPANALIAASKRGTQFRPGYARDVIRATSDACGIKGITPHRLRGTYATHLSKLAPIQDVQEAMRHKSALTTMEYLEKDMRTVEQAQVEMGEKMGMGSRENCAR